jgi:hypothetical protein
MAFTVSISSQAVFLDSRTRPGTVLLPSTFTIPGRTLTFKDWYGSFSTNTTILTVNNPNQTIDSNLRSTINRASFGWQTFIAGNTNNWYTVGGTLINTITTSTINSLLMSTPQISTGNILVSTLTLSDQVNASTNQVYTQSSFLYYKFGTTSTIISGTRQSFGGLFTPVRGAFLPNQISALQLWLDAADVNTVVVSSSLVTQWRDKSVNLRNMGTLVGTIRYGVFQSRPCIQQIAGSSLRVVSSVDLTSLTFFIVNCSISAANNQTVFAAMNSGSGFDYSSTVGFGFYVDGNTNPAGTRFYGTLTAGQNVTNTVAQTEIPYPFTLYVGRFTSAGALTTFVNGTAGGTASVGTRSSGCQGFALASTQGTVPTTANSAAYICEALVYNAALTDSQRQQVEGYLAWKWGLVGNLPSNHPYKFAPP